MKPASLKSRRWIAGLLLVAGSLAAALRLDALRRIGRAVDEAGLYERVLIPDQE